MGGFSYSMDLESDIDEGAAMQIVSEQMFDPFCREKAQQVYDISQELVAVDTGALKESGHIEEVGSAVGEGIWYVVYDAPTKDQSKWKSYAIFLELGTSKMSAQPYLRPAMEQVIGKL